MNGNHGARSIEPILQLIFDGRESEALPAIALEFGPSAVEELSLSAIAVGGKSDGEDGGRRDRVRLANLYRMSVFLMDRQCWGRAVAALGWTIRLSEDMQEAFFLEDCRLRKTLCQKILDQKTEKLKENETICTDKLAFIADKNLRVGDLD
jgi:hypothetical protein